MLSGKLYLKDWGEDNSFKPRNAFILAIVSFWTLLSLFTVIKAGAFRVSSGEEVYWAHISSFTFTSGLTWAALTFVIYRSVIRIELNSKKWLLPLGQHLFLAIFITGFQRFFSMSLDYLIQTTFRLVPSFPSYNDYFNDYFIERFVEGILWYLLIVIALYGYKYFLLFKFNKEKERRSISREELLIKSGGQYIKLSISDIICVKAQGNYCEVTTADGTHKCRESIKSLQQKLEGTEIVRIHNSNLINIRKISAYEHVQRGEYNFKLTGLNKRLNSSLSYRESVKEIIEQFHA